MSDFLNTADVVLGLAIIAGLPAYPLLQLWAARNLPPGWRFAAMLPLALGTLLLGCCLAAIAGKAGLSLAPLIFFAPAAALYLLGVVGIRAMVTGAAR